MVATRTAAAEFFALPETAQPTELVDGEVIASPSPMTVHQRFILNLAVLLRNLIRHGEVFIAPTES